ncbi:MAG: hypothetical protein ABEJ76_08365 [Halanaeroarchaeum sp.]
MKKTPTGTSVGVADPYEHAGICDHATDDGRCRYAFEYPQHDVGFAEERREDDFRCPVAADDWTFADCPHYRFRAGNRECARCGLTEHRDAHEGGRPLLEEHHLAYADDRDLGHEITVYLCRWCHAKVHDSWASVGDDVNPDPEALAAREERRSKELSELSFDSAADRFDADGA